MMQQKKRKPPQKPKAPSKNKRNDSQSQLRKKARKYTVDKRRMHKKPSPKRNTTRINLKVDTNLRPYRSLPRDQIPKYLEDYDDNSKKKSPPKKSASRFARAPSPRELARLRAEEERLRKLNKQMEKERKRMEQKASPGKKPPAPKKEIDNIDKDIKDFETFLTSLKLNDDPKKEPVKPNEIEELLEKLKLTKNSSSPTVPSLANHPTIKKVSAIIKTAKNKSALRNLLNRFKKYSKKKPPAPKKNPSPKTLKLKKPKISPGKMKPPPNSPDDNWLNQFLKKKPPSPRSPKKSASPSSLKSNETYDDSPHNIMADHPPPPNKSFYNVSPPLPPLERISQPYSTMRLTPSPKEGSPIEKYKPRRGATPHIKSVQEWGPDRVIDDIEREEKLKAHSSPKKSAKPQSSRAYRPRSSKSSRGWQRRQGRQGRF